MADTKNIPIADASDSQIREFLTTFLQVEVGAASSRAELLAQLSKAWQQEHIVVLDEGELELSDEQIVTPEVQAKDLTTRYQDDPAVELKIGKTGYPGGEHPASPRVNGRQIVIQRDVLVKVPYRFYLALLNSYEDQTRADPKTGHPVVTRVTNFPLFDVKLPPQSEIDAWHERTRDVVGA